jgi:hypothetical protein
VSSRSQTESDVSFAVSLLQEDAKRKVAEMRAAQEAQSVADKFGNEYAKQNNFFSSEVRINAGKFNCVKLDKSNFWI